MTGARADEVPAPVIPLFGPIPTALEVIGDELVPYFRSCAGDDDGRMRPEDE
jgi:hypothetical protein